MKGRLPDLELGEQQRAVTSPLQATDALDKLLLGLGEVALERVALARRRQVETRRGLLAVEDPASLAGCALPT